MPTKRPPRRKLATPVKQAGKYNPNKRPTRPLTVARGNTGSVK